MKKFVEDVKDLFCFRRKFLVYNLVLRNMKLRYRKSFLGMLWTVLIPAGSAAVYYFVFSFVLKVNVEHHLLFILCGLIPWTFFSMTLNNGMESLIYNYELLNKIPLPLQSLTLAEAITHLLNLFLSIPVIAIIMFISKVTPTLAMVQVFPLVLLLFVQSYCVALILAITVVYFRDVRAMLSLVLQFWFYLTPIMYTAHMVPDKFRFGIYLNPVGSIFVGLNSSITEGYWLNANDWTAAIAWTLLMALIAKGLLESLRSSVVEIL